MTPLEKTCAGIVDSASSLRGSLDSLSKRVDALEQVRGGDEPANASTQRRFGVANATPVCVVLCNSKCTIGTQLSCLLYWFVQAD